MLSEEEIEIKRKKNREYQAEYRKKNPEKVKKYGKLWRLKNSDYHKKRRKSGLLTNSWEEKHRKQYRAEYQRKRLKSDPAYRAIANTRHRIHRFIKNKFGFSSSLGCSFKDFKQHIEKQFKSGMTWDNYGEWHIDHINPLSVAIKENKDSFKKACHYTNLQPLWAKDNIKKGNKNG